MIQLRNGLNCHRIGFQDGWQPRTTNYVILLSPLGLDFGGKEFGVHMAKEFKCGRLMSSSLWATG